MADEALRHAIEMKAKVEAWLVLHKPDWSKIDGPKKVPSIYGA